MALTDTPTVVASVTDDNRSYLDWPAILAGTVLATAISFVLLTFGSALGLSFTSAYEGEGMSVMWFAIVAALWLMWVQICSFLAGGYLAGRMRRRIGDATEYESDIRDGSQGLTVWALGVLISAFIAFAGISGAISTAASTVSTVAGAAGNAAAAAADAVDPNALLIDRTLRRADGTTAQNAAEVRDAVGRVLVSAVTEGQVDDADRQYLVSTVAAQAGIPPEEAQQRVDQLVTQANELEAQARAAADRARRLTMIAAFITAASLLIGGAAAYIGATMGGNHRDKQTVFLEWIGRR